MSGFDVQAFFGVWTKPSPNTLLGCTAVDEFDAFCLAGSELRSDYSVTCSIKLVEKCLAGVLVGYSQTVNYGVRKTECILDHQLQALYVKMSFGGDFVVVGYRKCTLEVGKSYQVKASLRRDLSGLGRVIFSVDGVVQLRIDYLSSSFSAGLYGFLLGTSEDSGAAVMFQDLYYHSEQFLGSVIAVKLLCKRGGDVRDDLVFEDLLCVATDWLSGQLAQVNGVIPFPAPQSLNQICTLYAAGSFLERDITENKMHHLKEEAYQQLQTYLSLVYGVNLDDPGAAAQQQPSVVIVSSKKW